MSDDPYLWRGWVIIRGYETASADSQGQAAHSLNLLLHAQTPKFEDPPEDPQP